MNLPAPRRDRRQDRREQTLAEIVDVAVSVMAEHGAAGLSLGEVARRVGMQTPSLYGYFPSKHALYDAVFERGWRELLVVLREQRVLADDIADLQDFLLGLANAFVRWAVEHPAYSQLMFWRPIPGYQPAAESYQPAVETLAEARGIMLRLQSLRLLTAAVDTERLLSTWTVLVAGVVTQQLANAPDESFDSGSFTALIPDLVTMFVQQHAVALSGKRSQSGGRSLPRTRKP